MNFDRVAPCYSLLERLTVGSLQQRARCHFLPAVASARRALLVGEGDGRFLRAALAVCPATQFTVVEASERMLARARRATADTGRVEFVHARLPDWRPAAGPRFDLVVTNFFFDCFPPAELGPIVEPLAQVAAADCAWLVAEFLPARHWRSRVLLTLAYAFFRHAAGVRARAIPEHADLLRAQGFRLLGELRLSAGLLAAQHWRRSSPSA